MGARHMAGTQTRLNGWGPGLRLRRIDDRQSCERSSLEAAIAGEQAVGQFKRVGADEKVGHAPFPGAASPSIGSPRQASTG